MKPIEQIAVGDLVLSFEKDWNFVPGRVIKTILHEGVLKWAEARFKGRTKPTGLSLEHRHSQAGDQVEAIENMPIGPVVKSCADRRLFSSALESIVEIHESIDLCNFHVDTKIYIHKQIKKHTCFYLTP